MRVELLGCMGKYIRLVLACVLRKCGDRCKGNHSPPGTIVRPPLTYTE